jgi:tetratricopeptide (TPR) repeat protein
MFWRLVARVERGIFRRVVARALACTDQGKLDDAIDDNTAAIKLSPTSADLYEARENAWDTKGDHDKAVEDYNEATKRGLKRNVYNQLRNFFSE